MRAALALFLAASISAAQPDQRVESILKRVSEEAEAFASLAQKAVSEETLHQRVVLPPPRFRPRAGAAALEKPKERVRSREIISEFGYSTWKDSPGVLHEFRRVISADGKRVESMEKARATLTAGITSKDDVVRKQMLRDFEKLGLVGGATDLSQLLLLFLRRNLDHYSFTLWGRSQTGADPALVLVYRQRAGSEGLTVFEGREAIHQALHGELWVREADGVPLKITLVSSRQGKKEVVRDEIAVDYAMSGHGAVTPVSAVFREFGNDRLQVENVYRYAPFKRFSADTEIKFTEVPEPPPLASPPGASPRKK